ncbi:hypothetical protein GIB67_001916 [Kingdonia uniflora]|uniref:Starch synthase catalytic domain-containing protein n=1 Tax=Kingdonia uniflora TaxID=39325 RepID=A0A7J7NVG8_9MAGN|nr:hypothetical protein GIB67_001916 [Kingdonia uniflora]
MNKVELLQLKNNSRAVVRQARKSGFKTKGARISGVITSEGGMNLVFVGAKVGPWRKTRRRRDVLGGLPLAMADNGHRVMTVSPRYDQYKDAWDTSLTVEIKVRNKIETVWFFHCYKRGVDCSFIDHPIFLEKVALEALRVLSLKSNKYFLGPYSISFILCLFN